MHRRHEQRIAPAAAAALEGNGVAFSIDGGSQGTGMASYLVWHSPVRRVIASGSRRSMEALLPSVQAEFKRQLKEAIALKEAARANPAEISHERRPGAAH